MGKPRKRRIITPVRIKPPEHPWERLQHETDPAWQAFVIYRDLGPDKRTHRAVSSQLGKSRVQMEEWSSKYQWVDRCHEYDQNQDREARAVVARDRRKMLELAHRLNHLEIQTAYNEARKLAARSAATQEPVLSAEQVERKVDSAIRRVLTECGEPTEISESRQSVVVEDRRAEIRSMLMDKAFMEALYGRDLQLQKAQVITIDPALPEHDGN